MASTALQRLRTFSSLLDDAFRIPGTRVRFGLDPIIGLLPVGGDLAGALLSAWMLLAGTRMGAPPSVLLRMGGNIALDAIVGSVPVLGDIFDFAWKANRRNLVLLERYEADPARVRRGSRLLLLVLLLGFVALLALMGYATWALLHWLGHRL